jgi:hypothetical protein
MPDYDLLAVADQTYLRYRSMGRSEAERVEAVTNAIEAEVRNRLRAQVEARAKAYPLFDDGEPTLAGRFAADVLALLGGGDA